MPHLTDEQAMWRLQTREDETAFVSLVRRWQDPIRRLCVRMAGDAHLGEDLAQETFARVFLRRHDFARGSRFSTWLWRIALNLCHDAHRRRERRPESILPETVDPETAAPCWDVAEGPAPDEATARRESAFLVEQALQSLSESHRAVVVLRHYQSLKFREIAEVLDIPEGTVKSRMADALTHLEHQLKPLLSECGASTTRTGQATWKRTP
jgi:RNA polymerase sigma-70 factor (ECF subfamily)